MQHAEIFQKGFSYQLCVLFMSVFGLNSSDIFWIDLAVTTFLLVAKDFV